MPTEDKLTDDQAREFAMRETSGQSPALIKKKMGISQSSFSRLNADLEASIGKRKQSPKDLRIRRLLRELVFNPNELHDEDLKQQIMQMVSTNPAAAKLLTLSQDLDDAIKKRQGP